MVTWRTHAWNTLVFRQSKNEFLSVFIQHYVPPGQNVDRAKNWKATSENKFHLSKQFFCYRTNFQVSFTSSRAQFFVHFSVICLIYVILHYLPYGINRVLQHVVKVQKIAFMSCTDLSLLKMNRKLYPYSTTCKKLNINQKPCSLKNAILKYDGSVVKTWNLRLFT